MCGGGSARGLLQRRCECREAVRIVTRVLALAVFAYPVLTILSLIGARVLGFATMPRFDGPIATWLLVDPVHPRHADRVPVAALAARARARRHSAVRRARGPGARGTRARTLGTLVIVGGFAIYTPVRILAQRDEVRFRAHRLGHGAASEAPLRIAFVSDVHLDAHTRPSRVDEVFVADQRRPPRPRPVGWRLDQHRPRLHRSGGHGGGNTQEPARHVLGARRSRELRVPRSRAQRRRGRDRHARARHHDARGRPPVVRRTAASGSRCCSSRTTMSTGSRPKA